MSGFKRWPQLLSGTNQEIADALMIRHPMTVSQALSSLHEEGRIRVWFDGELKPVRHIDVIE